MSDEVADAALDHKLDADEAAKGEQGIDGFLRVERQARQEIRWNHPSLLHRQETPAPDFSFGAVDREFLVQWIGGGGLG